jgi:uncharacterized protein YoaH (UPF0181 family)
MLMATDKGINLKSSNTVVLSCFPTEGMTSGQAVRIVTKYLNARPERLHHDAHVLVIEALQEAFPCK